MIVWEICAKSKFSSFFEFFQLNIPPRDVFSVPSIQHNSTSRIINDTSDRRQLEMSLYNFYIFHCVCHLHIIQILVLLCEKKVSINTYCSKTIGKTWIVCFQPWICFNVVQKNVSNMTDKRRWLKTCYRIYDIHWKRWWVQNMCYTFCTSIFYPRRNRCQKPWNIFNIPNIVVTGMQTYESSSALFSFTFTKCRWWCCYWLCQTFSN